MRFTHYTQILGSEPAANFKESLRLSRTGYPDLRRSLYKKRTRGCAPHLRKKRAINSRVTSAERGTTARGGGGTGTYLDVRFGHEPRPVSQDFVELPQVLELLRGPVQPVQPLGVPSHVQKAADVQVHQVRALVPGRSLRTGARNTVSVLCGRLFPTSSGTS